MSSGAGPERRWWRLLRVALLAVGGVLGLVLGPDLVWGIPIEVRYWLFHPLTLMILVGAALLVPPPWPLPRVVGEAGARLLNWPARSPRLGSMLRAAARTARRAAPIRERADDLTDELLGRPLAILVGAVCLFMLASWVPHFLTWPWWCDLDQFAAEAQAWDVGIVPYRDLDDFDFPGPIYLLWPLGTLFGWGRTAPIYGLDVAFLVLLGAVLVIWSRRRFGRSLPGLAGLLVFLGYYLGLDYALVAQRDWRASLFVVVGLLTMEAWPGRPGRLASAALMGLALAFRPQIVLFLPALASAIDEGSRRPDEPWTRSIRPLLEWSSAAACFTVLAFSPLLWAGVVDDFARLVEKANYGGSYNRVNLNNFSSDLRYHLSDWWTTRVVAGVVLLGLLAPPETRRLARTWALASLGVLLYRPLSPVHHQYLVHPLMLVWSVDLALIVAWLASARGVLGPLRGPVVVALLVLGVGRIPPYCTISGSLNAVPALVRGDEPVHSPPGSERWISDQKTSYYRWSDYRDLLAFLRQTDPRIRVANVLRIVPFPPVNGPSGRVTPFPAAGGVIHLALVDPGLEDGFVEALERTPNVLVVWENDDSMVDIKFRCKKVARAIRRLYRPIRKFGHFEVWARKDATSRLAPGSAGEPPAG